MDDTQLLAISAVRGACPHDCPDTCAWQVIVKNGVAVKLLGDIDHPFTRGGLCAKVNHYLERVYSPDRILFPLRRVGPKGAGIFERVEREPVLEMHPDDATPRGIVDHDLVRVYNDRGAIEVRVRVGDRVRDIGRKGSTEPVRYSLHSKPLQVRTLFVSGCYTSTAPARSKQTTDPT